MLVCADCLSVFSHEDLKVTCAGFGCPYCGSINYNREQNNRAKDGSYIYDKVDVKYEEGPHD
jgi:predicted RNA-binding Zn-ribbon protein involved in translation (DUF1610 family)